MWRKEVSNFELNEFYYLNKIHGQLRDGVYRPANYVHIHIDVPKPREIYTLPYNDRVVHQWYVEEAIKPYYVPRFIVDTYACIAGRGAHLAVDRVEYFMRRVRRRCGGDYYVVKMDISKFFNSIDRDILFELVTRPMRDGALRELTRVIVYHDTGVIGETGIAIGNYTSQYFANIYLDGLDHFVKTGLGVSEYVRYMDDFICVVEDKQRARYVMERVGEYVRGERRLELNVKSGYFPGRLGVDFCGYRLDGDRRWVRVRAKRSICRIIDEYECGRVGAMDTVARVESWLGSAMQADSYRLAVKRLGGYGRLFGRLVGADGWTGDKG
jgi:hypothetical protein